MNKFIENFLNILDDTDSSMIVPLLLFKELDEWSSIVALSLISMVDEEYDVMLSADDVKNSNTLEDLYKLIVSKC